VIASPAATSTSDESVAAYEELRNRVLANSTSGGHFGLLLLIREGIAAWMARCSIRAVPSLPLVDPAQRAAVPLVSDEIHAGIVRVLASMALAGRGEMSP